MRKSNSSYRVICNTKCPKCGARNQNMLELTKSNRIEFESVCFHCSYRMDAKLDGKQIDSLIDVGWK